MNYGDFNYGQYLVLNDAGQTAFYSYLTGGVASYRSGIWSEGSGSLALVAHDVSQAAGTPSGVNYLFGLNGLVLNNAGQTAFYADLTDSYSYDGIWSEGSGSLALVARSGSQAAGTPSGVNYNGFTLHGPKLNDAGQIAFKAGLTGPGVDSTNRDGIWSEGSGSLTLVARSGDHAPGTPSGVTYNSLASVMSPALNNAGQTAFRAFLTGSGVDITNSSGIWSEGSGNLALVARLGSQAPGTPSGVNYGTFSDPVLNNAGQTAFFANLSGTGVDSTNDQGIWSERSGSLALVARAGSQAPGTPSGVSYGSRFGSTNINKSPVLNDIGQTAFSAFLTGSGVDFTNNSGIWATDQIGVLQLIARTGDPLEWHPATSARSVFWLHCQRAIAMAGPADSTTWASSPSGQFHRRLLRHLRLQPRRHSGAGVIFSVPRWTPLFRLPPSEKHAMKSVLFLSCLLGGLNVVTPVTANDFYPGFALVVQLPSHEAFLKNLGGSPIRVDGYAIDSASGSLNVASWAPLDSAGPEIVAALGPGADGFLSGQPKSKHLWPN